MPRLNRGPARPKHAPTYQIAQREITAVEHPMIIQNLDNGINTFGRNRPFQRILNSIDSEECVPLYLRQYDPMCVPILSHNTPTNNVLLKITVPKRTGRKRKRGSQDPYEDSDHPAPAQIPGPVPSMPTPTQNSSLSRRDDPTQILRKLKDNVGKYTVEAVGEIRQTHRYRGMSDFHQSSSKAEFVQKFQNTFLTGKIEKIRDFKLDESKGWKPNEEIVPPPIMSSHALPFNWGWHQATHLTQEQDRNGNRILVNHSKPERGGVQYLVFDVVDVPTEPDRDEPTDENILDLIDVLKQAMEERPIWTRRSLLNRVANARGIYTFKQAIPFVGYQFKGGPWRDALIKFGVDPRKDPKYRQYQTFFFQFLEESEKVEGEPWRDNRPNFTISKAHGLTHTKDDTHVFDGKKLTLDGKIWQVCDITVPLLVNLMEDAPYRDKCEILSDGWYCNGTIAKFKGIMKTKLIAVKAKKDVADSEFQGALAIPDIVPDRLSKQISVPLPDLGLSEEELAEMEKKGILNKSEASTIHRWFRNKKSYKSRTERLRDNSETKRIVRGPRKPKVKNTANAEAGGAVASAGDAEAVDTSVRTGSAGPEVLTIPPDDQTQLASVPEEGAETTDAAGEGAAVQMDRGTIETTAANTLENLDNEGAPRHLDGPTTLGMVASSPGMIPSDDEGMDTDEERDALASDMDDDDEDYFSDAVEHQVGTAGDGGKGHGDEED